MENNLFMDRLIRMVAWKDRCSYSGKSNLMERVENPINTVISDLRNIGEFNNDGISTS